MLGVLFFFCLALLISSTTLTIRFVSVVELILVVSFVLSFGWGFNLNLFHSRSIIVISWDRISLGLVILAWWCSLLIVLGSFHFFKKNLSPYLFLVTVISLLLILSFSFTIRNLLVFYILFEFSLIPTFLLIMKWGYQPERVQASLYMIIYTVCASLPLLMSIVYIKGVGYNINMFVVWWNIKESNFIWALFLIGAFFVKIPLYFTHLWLPKAHVEAPVAGSMILAGILLKLGSYGLARVIKIWYMLIFQFSEVFVCVSLIGGALTGIICVAQSDLKSLIAYSSIGHIGVLSAGLLSINYYGLIGAVIMIVAHGLCSSGIFFISNTFYQNRKSRSVLINKGVLHFFPFMVMFSFLIFSCNMSAPPSINLAGELILSMGILSFRYVRAVPIGLITFLSGVYSIYLYVLASHGIRIKSFGSWKEVKDYDLLTLLLHFFPIWVLIINIKVFVCLSSLK